MLLHGEVDQQAAKGGNGNVGVAGDVRPDQLEALLGGEQRALVGIVGDGDQHVVEQTRGARKDVEVPIREGIKSARIDAESHGGTWIGLLVLSLPRGPTAEQADSKSKTATKGKRGGGAAAGCADPPGPRGE